ncbi:MAG: RtcB family protein [Clostridiales bacterium]|nr:RtcB family protein [Clostridiales bacterium]
MVEIKGRYNTAIVFTQKVEKGAIEQIRELCDQEFIKGSLIRIMPDVHEGLGCTIGTTMTIGDKIVPSLVGVDIGCGIETIELKDRELDLEKLDSIIYKYIPAGFKIRNKLHKYVDNINFDGLICREHVDLNRGRLSIGTLGGGNHFIEVNKDQKGCLYLTIHSGSRHLGKQVAEYYQKLAYRKLRDKSIKVNKHLAYLEDKDYNDYLNDMAIVQKYAVYNRKAIVDEIISRMKLNIESQFTTIHNYIDLDGMILRKGAISAQKGEKILIPINMRDGSLICIGKGNREWNYSAPHGAGRVMSRTQARRQVSLKDFKESMKGIYTTSVNKSTVDEAPVAYKPMEEIINSIQDTAEILDIIRPIYNFKA